MQNKKADNIDFIGIGAPKSGTTWLVSCLSEHPDLYIPPIKEICFFNALVEGKHYLKGLDWYLNFFKGAPQNSKKGEFTTHYMYFEDSAELIQQNFPKTKILVCLRKPEDMVYSLYWWRKASFQESDLPDTFEKAIKTDKVLLDRGLYYKQLKRFYDKFPHKNILVLIYDDIILSPKKVLKDVFTFLGVDPTYTPDNIAKRINSSKKVRSKLLNKILYSVVKGLKKVNMNTEIRNILLKNELLSILYTKVFQTKYKYPMMSPETQKILKQYYLDDVEKLKGLIGNNLSQWKY